MSHFTKSNYLDAVAKFERDSAEKLAITRTAYEKQRDEIEQLYQTECNKAIQEYHEKKREIKENLKSEQEEMRKQIEVDRGLDINADVTDAKPVPTRNLRRRQNANNTTLNMTYDEADVDATLLIQSSVIGANLAGHNAASGVNIVASGLSVANSSTTLILGQYSSSSLNHVTTLSGFYSTLNSGALANSAGQAVNDRKRKPNQAAITFALTDEEMNEDLKFLAKNLNNHTFGNAGTPLSCQKQSDAKSTVSSTSPNDQI